VIVLLAAVVALKAAVLPPATLNIVHHKLKRGTPSAYQSVEASIVAAYDRAKIPLYWLTFQSVKDPRDVLYLNLFDTPADLARATDTYRSLAPAHPELGRLSTRLSSMVDTQTSVLTARRGDVSFTRTDVDFSTMRALMLATFRVKAGHEGQFIDATRKAGGGGAPWIVYESTADPTFVLLWPLKSRSEARAASIPRALRELRRTYMRTDVGVYALAPAMTRTPTEFYAKGKNAAPKPKAQ
jgi:hypothetical protein